MKLSIATSLTCMLLGSAAFAAKPLVVVPQLKAGKGVSKAIGERFDKTLRVAVGKRAKLVSKKGTGTALKAAGGAPCSTDACGGKLAEATKARFVLTSVVTNEDEIYEVKLSLFDAALKKRIAAKAVCELCAAEEVGNTIGEAVGQLKKALKVKAPKVAPKPAKKAGVALTTIPDGATVLIDGKPVKGLTPGVFVLKPGKHKILVKKTGYTDLERQVTIMDRQLKLSLTLKEAPAVVTPPPPVAVPAVATAKGPGVSDAAVKYAWGATIGGAILAGVGTYLVVLDGDVTCNDKGRTECATVFNTKGPGIAALGLGAALVGSGITVVVFAATDDSEPTEAKIGATEGGGAIFNLSGRF